VPEEKNIKKRSVKISGHSTSITIEDEFWAVLKDIAAENKTSLNKLISDIDENENEGNLSSALRLYVLRDLQAKLLQQPL